jgi:dTDP-4-amino-4,6-dideoxygalactose transaminase
MIPQTKDLGTNRKVFSKRKIRATFLPFSAPSIGEEEIAEVVDTLRSDWLATGPKVERFEREFAAFLTVPSALALNSGTAALHLALASLDIGPGDAVITTPMTFCSTVHVIEQVGARPILVDVEPDTLNIDPQRIEDTLKSEIRNPKCEIKAVLPVHLYGHPCEMEQILRLASHNNWAVIEDAAHALPARYKGRLIGSPNPYSEGHIPNLICFSFYATKNLTTAEGGMLIGPPTILEKARVLSLHGMNRNAWKRYSSEGSWYYEVVAAGFKYNLTDIAAALGLHQLRKLSLLHARRRQIAARYQEAFSQIEELEVPVARSEVEHAWHLYILRLNLERLRISRNQFIEELRARNIGTSVHFIPVHIHPYYRNRYGFKPNDFPVAYQEYQRMLSLPLYPKMKDQDVEDVINAVLQAVQKFRK